MNPLSIILMSVIVIVLAGLYLMGRGGSSGSGNWMTNIKETLLRLMARGLNLNLYKPWSPERPMTFAYNPDCWAASLDWSGVATSINGIGSVGGGTLITRRHVLFATHVPYPKTPFNILFTSRAGVTTSYSVIKIDQVDDTDISIGTLERDVDPSLRVYRVLPDDWVRYVEGVVIKDQGNVRSITMRLPVLYTNMARSIQTGDVFDIRLPIDGVAFAANAGVEPPVFDPAKAFWRVQEGGDSGNPIFVLVGDELVLLGAWWKVAVFPWLISRRARIEQIIGQPLGVANLSRFNRVA